MDLAPVRAGHARTSVDAQAVSPTEKDLAPLRAGRSRAVMAGVGGVLALGLMVVGGLWMSREPSANTPPIKPLSAGAVGQKAPLRELPPASTPAVTPQAPADTHLVGLASDRRQAQDGATEGSADAVRMASAQKPVLAATVLAKDTQPVRMPDAEPARPTRKPARTARDGRIPAARTEGERTEEVAREPIAATGTLTLKVKGYVKDVLVDGESRGRKYQLDLPAGLHRLEVRGNQFTRPYSTPITILAGELTEQHVELEPIP
jgi:hypothetical protein